MNNRMLLTYVLVGGFAAGAVQAEPVLLNNYPDIPGDAEISLHNSLPISVPQPGDAYFDPPSATPEWVSEQASAPANEVEQPPVETIDISSMFSDFEDENEMLVMRMSEDPFEDIKAETSSQAELQAVPQSAPEDIQPAAGRAPEEILWSGPRVEPQVEPQGDASFWAALEGTNIRQVLGEWASNAGVEMVWDSQDAFAVLESYSASGSFEGAVKDLLDQYQDNQVRPVATLHMNPENGQKTLVVKAFEES